MKDDGLSDELVEMCSQVVDTMAQLLSHTGASTDGVTGAIYAIGGAIGGYIHTLSQLLGLPLADAFLEGFASFRRFLHRDESQLSMFSSLTRPEHKN